MNKVILVGYLVKDPVARFTNKTNIEQSNFSVAVQDAKSYEDTHYFNCVAWNQTAKYINSNLEKGRLVAIDGRLTTRSYENNEGKKTYTTEIIVESIKAYGPSKKTLEQQSNSVSKIYEAPLNLDGIINNDDQPSSNSNTSIEDELQEWGVEE